MKPDGDGNLPLKLERFGAVLATTIGPDQDAELKELMVKMAAFATKPIADFSAAWDYAFGARVPPPRAEAPQSVEGMQHIPGGPLRFSTRGIEIEGSGGAGDQSNIGVNPFGVDFQYEWETQPSR